MFRPSFYRGGVIIMVSASFDLRLKSWDLCEDWVDKLGSSMIDKISFSLFDLQKTVYSRTAPAPQIVNKVRGRIRDGIGHQFNVSSLKSDELAWWKAYEQTKKFRWSFHKSILGPFMCILFIDIAQGRNHAPLDHISDIRMEMVATPVTQQEWTRAEEQELSSETQESGRHAARKLLQVGQTGHLLEDDKKDTATKELQEYLLSRRRVRHLVASGKATKPIAETPYRLFTRLCDSEIARYSSKEEVGCTVSVSDDCKPLRIHVRISVLSERTLPLLHDYSPRTAMLPHFYDHDSSFFSWHRLSYSLLQFILFMIVYYLLLSFIRSEQLCSAYFFSWFLSAGTEGVGEIKKLEIELWNLKVKGNDVPTYTERFQELTLICTKFFANETKKIDKYISGLPDNIYGSVKYSRPKMLDETIELANDFMEQKLRTYVERQPDNKRKADDSTRNNHGHQQQPFKRQNVAKVYNMGTGEKKPYGGSFPKCTKCQFHHNGPCTQKCHKCNQVGHFARDCRSSGNTNVANTQKGNGVYPKGNGCFECGTSGHFKKDCPKLKNKNEGSVNAQGWVYAVGNAEKKGNASRDPDSNVVTGTFLLNNRYASILFDTGADRSFISTAFSSLINIAPTPLENSYDVELANGKIVEIDTIVRGCNLNFLNHPFNIDQMLIELGSFDVIIGIDWLRRYHAVIVCDEKLVRVPYGNETLIFRGNESNDGRESRLTIILCSKAQEYMAKGCQIFLAQISAKKEEDKSEGKQLKDVPIVQDFPEVFPEDLSALPPA
ncbi:putative reverse transcriptase domain-containing protein [Tanacetum coccineum]